MKLLFGYTFDYIKRNRRGSLAIMIAILMTSTMLSALCGFFFNTYSDNLRLILKETGNWHGELFDSTLGSDLQKIETFDSIESIMIKGNWKTAQIEDSRRDYLIWRDANAQYWESMPEGDSAILEGRVPSSVDEIALSKQYFDQHPELKLGDTLTLPLGYRVTSHHQAIAATDKVHEGEYFTQTGTVTLTIVGKLDAATSSTVPAYTALGYLTPDSILPEDDITVYFRFKNIQDTYKELPRIAQAIGYEPDEYGNYNLRYNVDYLTRKAVLSPAQTGLLPLLLANQAPLMFGVMGLLVAALFVLIIHNGFSLSSSARLSQLGIFASVGATPKQIKRSVVLEAFLLTIIPLPLGLVLGQISVIILLNIINKLALLSNTEPVIFTLGWQSLLPSVLLTILTVWWSALIPARKIAKMSPIAAIRQGGTETLKKPKRFTLGKLFGLPGELAANALHARKKSYRTATISLTLSFLTLASFLCITSASTASKNIYKTDENRWADQDILLTLYHVAAADDFTNINKKLHDLDSISSIRWCNTLQTATWLSEDAFSTEFAQKGSFEAVEKKLSSQQVPLLRDDKRRVRISILGLDDETFSNYCDTLEIDSASFYETESPSSILYHSVDDIKASTKRTPVLIPFFNIAPGDTLTLTEKTTDSTEGDYTFHMKIAAIADELPPVGQIITSRYSAISIMPMSQLKQLSTHFTKENTSQVTGILQVHDPAQITSTKNTIDQICERYFGSGDYRLTDEHEYYANKTSGDTLTALMFGFIVVLLSVIGLSNTWATTRGTLNARRQEFAMLRSVGLSPRGLQKMLVLEALILGLTPVLFSLPLIAVLQGLFLFINEVTFTEWLPFAPWLPVLLYTFSILAITAAAYAAGRKKLLRENIIEAIKSDGI